MNTTMNNLQKKELSILIPTYNDDCYDLVEQLARQAAAIDELEYEILVADDKLRWNDAVDICHVVPVGLTHLR